MAQVKQNSMKNFTDLGISTLPAGKKVQHPSEKNLPDSKKKVD